jgi:hypothetical protein
MARNPARVMGRTSWSTTRWGKSKARAYVNTLGMCERAASWGVPIASHMATQMIKAASTKKMLTMKPWLKEVYFENYRPWKQGEPVISHDTRLSYYEAWGYTPEEQEEIENSIKVDFLLVPSLEQLEEYSSYCSPQ